ARPLPSRRRRHDRYGIPEAHVDGELGRALRFVTKLSSAPSSAPRRLRDLSLRARNQGNACPAAAALRGRHELAGTPPHCGGSTNLLVAAKICPRVWRISCRPANSDRSVLQSTKFD